MILGNGSFGKDVLYGYQDIQPILTTYTKMTIYGQNTGAIYDKIWGRKVPMSPTTIEDYNNTPSWTNDTYFLALFNHSLSAGNVTGFTDEITKWLIYRENTINNVIQYVDSVPFGEIKYIDYTAIKDNTYRYDIFAASATQVSNALSTNYILSTYYGYFLIDVDDDIVYIFNAEVTGGELTQNMDYSKFDGNTKFSKYSVGAKNYISSAITGLVKTSTELSYMNVTSVEVLNELQKFIQNPNKTKLLKTRKGEIFPVFTYGYVETPLNQSIGVQPMLVTFNYEQIGDIYE